MMARGLSIDKLLYLLFHAPSHLSTCFLTANCSFATLPLTATAMMPFSPSSPVNVMHSARSLLFAFLASILFGIGSEAGPLFSRQYSNGSSSVYNTRFPDVKWDNDLWRVTTTALDQGHYQSRQSVANGYIGVYSHGGDGFMCCDQGKPLIVAQVSAFQPWAPSSSRTPRSLEITSMAGHSSANDRHSQVSAVSLTSRQASAQPK